MSSVPRPARGEDAAEIARLAGELGYPSTPEAMGARLERLREDPHQRVWVMERGGRLIGWLSAERRLVLESGERVEITGLVVEADVRRGGIGRTLVAAAEAWALSRGRDTVVVRSKRPTRRLASVLRGPGLRAGEEPARTSSR